MVPRVKIPACSPRKAMAKRAGRQGTLMVLPPHEFEFF